MVKCGQNGPNVFKYGRKQALGSFCKKSIEIGCPNPEAKIGCMFKQFVHAVDDDPVFERRETMDTGDCMEVQLFTTPVCPRIGWDAHRVEEYATSPHRRTLLAK